ncbi:MAG: DUF721 domain-containing protein [Candidatus Komeilibacteria bacterium]|nr:DUF721 domain-containing protein [Candidatus Komeilibacteria bacterium]
MWQSLGDLIPQSLKKSGIHKAIDEAMLLEEFNQIAKHILDNGPEQCRAVYIKDHYLWIAVLSKAAANELKFSETDILKALADKFGEGRVLGLRFIS